MSGTVYSEDAVFKFLCGVAFPLPTASNCGTVTITVPTNNLKMLSIKVLFTKNPKISNDYTRLVQKCDRIRKKLVK
jgi:hypothetical protein